MVDGQDLRDGAFQTVNDPVVAKEDLADRGFPEFRDDAARAGEARKALDGGQDVQDEEAGVVG